MRFLRPAGGVSNLKSACFTTSLQQYDSEISPLSSHLHDCILRVSDSSIVQHSDVVNTACLQMSAVNMQHLDTTFNIDSATALRSSRLLLHDEKTIEHPLSKAIAARNEMACACISCAARQPSRVLKEARTWASVRRSTSVQVLAQASAERWVCVML